MRCSVRHQFEHRCTRGITRNAIGIRHQEAFRRDGQDLTGQIRIGAEAFNDLVAGQPLRDRNREQDGLTLADDVGDAAHRLLINDGFLALTYGGAEAGDYLVRHPRIEAVHLTGSSRTYDAIVWGVDEAERERRRADRAPRVDKPVSAELGCVTAIIRIWKSVTAEGGRLAVFAPTAVTWSTLKLSGLTAQLTITQNAAEALTLLGVSRAARRRHREALLLNWSSPIAAAIAVISLVLMRFSISPVELEPSIARVMTVSALLASGGGGLAIIREIGAFLSLQGLVSITGLITLLTAYGPG